MLRLRMMVVAAWIGVGLIELPLEAQAPVQDSWGPVAESFVRKLAAKDFAGAAAMVGPRMRQAGVTQQMLEQSWQQLTAAGAFGDAKVVEVTESGGLHVVDLRVTFGQSAQLFRLAVDAEQRIETFRLMPQTAPVQSPPPPYARADAFEEQELVTGAEGWPLAATLTLPKGVSRAPVVVLVHGSGAHDRDETIAGNKPFRDLAQGLASRGIAVLRYEKRNYKHAARMAQAPFTVDDEVIADALAAVAQLRAHPRIDPARVYVLGHSLGGMLAPEIAARDGKLGGVILLAGSPRPLAELIVDQVAYLKSLPANAAPAAQQQLDALGAGAQRLLRNEVPPTEVVIGAPASYFYDMAKRDARAFLKQVKAPVLVLQGGRDYQVTQKDYDMFRAAAGNRTGAFFRLYPDLNHLFITGSGMATPLEYVTGRGHVDARVIEDITAFVKGELK